MAGTFGQFSTPIGPTNGGKTLAYNNLGTSPIVVAPANVNRGSITFHNPGSVNVVIFPVNVQNTPGTVPTSNSGQPSYANTALTPTTTTLGGGLMVYANGGQITLTGECSGSYQALATSGSNNPLTVIESNV